MVSIDTSGIVDGQEIDAADVTTPLNELVTAINNLINGTETFTAIDINGGAIDGATIGANSAAAGTFTTLAATDGSAISTLNGSNVTSGTVAAARVGNLPASKITSGTLDAARVPFGAPGAIGSATPNTGAFTTLTATGTTTITTIDCNGGAIDNTVIGANNAAAGTFTDLDIIVGGTQFTFSSGGALAAQHAVSGTNFVIQTYNSGTFNQTAFTASTTTAAISFYGGTPTTKQTVTGSRGGNAALASLLTALTNLGLITNSTTA